MGWVMMSEHELGRIEVLSRVVDGRMSATAAASVLTVSTRHIRRMVKRFREDGDHPVEADAGEVQEPYFDAGKTAENGRTPASV